MLLFPISLLLTFPDPTRGSSAFCLAPVGLPESTISATVIHKT